MHFANLYHQFFSLSFDGLNIGAVYRDYFGRHYPAMTFLEVKGLYDDDEGCLMEIEAVAVVVPKSPDEDVVWGSAVES